MEMKSLEKIVIFFGYFLIFLGVLANPYVLAQLFSPDGHIGTKIFIVDIFAFEFFLILLGFAFLGMAKNEAFFSNIRKMKLK